MWSSTTTTSSTWPCHCGRRCRSWPSRSRRACAAPRTPSMMGGRAGLDDDARRRRRRAARPAPVAERQQRVAGDAPFLLQPPVRWRTPPSESICEPYSAVVTWPTCSPSARTAACLGAEVAVGVDLHLHAAVAEDALGHDRDHVDALDLRGDDEGRRLVVGIGRAGADAGDEGLAVAQQARRPRPSPRNGTSRRPLPPPGARSRPGRGGSGGRRRCRSGRRRRCGRGGCGTAPGRRRR